MVTIKDFRTPLMVPIKYFIVLTLLYFIVLTLLILLVHNEFQLNM